MAKVHACQGAQRETKTKAFTLGLGMPFILSVSSISQRGAFLPVVGIISLFLILKVKLMVKNDTMCLLSNQRQDGLVILSMDSGCLLLSW